MYNMRGTHSQKPLSEPYTIQSIVRISQKPKGGTDGNLLKAKSGGKTSEISVDFTGTNLNDPRSVFYLEQNDEKEVNVLKFVTKDNSYYLGVNKAGKVKLCKLINSPANDKYFFRIQRIGLEFRSPVTFKSLKTGKFLHCDDGGKAFMKRAKISSNGQPKDRQTWFNLMPCTWKNTRIIKHQQDSSFAMEKEEEIISEDIRDGQREDWENSGIMKPIDKYQENRVYVSSV